MDVKMSPPVAELFYAKKIGRREVPGSIPGCACRPSRAEFSVVFSETRLNTGWDPLERPPQRTLPLQVPQADNWS